MPHWYGRFHVNGDWDVLDSPNFPYTTEGLQQLAQLNVDTDNQFLTSLYGPGIEVHSLSSTPWVYAGTGLDRTAT